ncbi:tRNA uridine(34) 5-carboxymethylaminomethyl modification radical SAM/GNAT enzyme Elp3 [Candidatus Dojkabacteria bacterium]|uniref:tRNA carboxymethyluridine synthase n=1 Tax=Candidatus Dojkabacteria bacterium TaxID=2099670 RepID=A0A955KVF6_9BACT|nr:tRNA uridine(34) 5-carboxymethylaminomethyl modification radical SAM/GNAT enzyme Elp3 [Candidatus Dojkabacteria bacterium]MCB9790919.1 tRNA uridine(34) 5-carboxymethylaminomethyl modification radical SAM/GNAT enzyme Elp3 [Candidatus Nomurabacteria bacterium]
MQDNKYNFDPKKYSKDLKVILKEIAERDSFDYKALRNILAKYPKESKGFFSKDELIAAYEHFLSQGFIEQNSVMERRIKMKPTRTISGVTTVTVLTKPFPCPGKCIFCPNDVRMPKSYLSDEPGAQRAERNNFDPYLQTYNRLLAIQNIGHGTEKVELIVLGGTWSFYPEAYQIWFVKECFRAMNDFGVQDRRNEVKTKNIFDEADKAPRITREGRSRTYNEIIDTVQKGQGEELLSESEFATWEELYERQKHNETAKSRCVGLVIETRPDYIDEKEVMKIRKLGATKVQIGIQSLDDQVMTLNMRGHGRRETENAIKLLRLAGFKIHGHWMANLYGSTPEKDIQDYSHLWGESIRPDELKIYPTSIIDKTELYELYKRGKYKPYSYEQLLKVLTEVMPLTPRYCRLTRVIRDIPSTDIVAGNKLTNFRQIAEEELNQMGKSCQCIRCREIRGGNVSLDRVEKEEIEYKTSTGREFFISYRTKDSDKICGFLRLSIPDKKISSENFIKELRDKAIIREVHVYGEVVGIGKESKGRSQHLGLGKLLIKRSLEIARENAYDKISVISAIGTKEYYKKRGFKEDGLYMSRATK